MWARFRVSWRAVSGIVTRVVAELAGTADRLDGLRKIGIDEIAYRKGHRYLLAVTDHETGRLAWAAEGRNAAGLLRCSRGPPPTWSSWPAAWTASGPAPPPPWVRAWPRP
jgi:transposase